MFVPLFQGQNLSLVDNKCASKTSIKSQAMDDVLEILIRNGGMLKFVCLMSEKINKSDMIIP